jgi:hypothetical protein
VNDTRQTWRNWGDHPFAVAIGVIASVVTIVTYVGGSYADRQRATQSATPPANQRQEVEQWLREAQDILLKMDLRQMNRLRLHPEPSEDVEKAMAFLENAWTTQGLRFSPILTGWTIESLTENRASVLAEVEIATQAADPRTGRPVYAKGMGRNRWTLNKIGDSWKLASEQPVGELRPSASSTLSGR